MMCIVTPTFCARLANCSECSLNCVNRCNCDLVVIGESHNLRNKEAYKKAETRYQTLMNAVIRSDVNTKVLMLSATSVNNRFT